MQLAIDIRRAGTIMAGHRGIPLRTWRTIMQTKRETGVSVAYDTAAATITWSDITGKEPAVVVNVDQLPEAIRDMALYHGIDQKVTDAGAMGSDYWDGKDKPKRYGTVAERMARMRRVAAGLAAGQWSTRVARDPLAGLSAEQLQAVIAQANSKLAALGVATEAAAAS